MRRKRGEKKKKGVVWEVAIFLGGTGVYLEKRGVSIVPPFKRLGDTVKKKGKKEKEKERKERRKRKSEPQNPLSRQITVPLVGKERPPVVLFASTKPIFGFRALEVAFLYWFSGFRPNIVLLFFEICF